jgi:lactobin A/cerein 7B family class IIb bacteriocin
VASKIINLLKLIKMKQLSLVNFGVQELDAREMKETDGGIVIWALVLGIVVGLVATHIAIGLDHSEDTSTDS